MASENVCVDETHKTVLIYRADRESDPVRIERIDLKTKERVTMTLSLAELSGLAQAAPALQTTLSNAGVENAEGSIASRSISKASPARASSLSSHQQGRLV